MTNWNDRAYETSREESKCRICRKLKRFADKNHKLCSDCKTIYEWQYDRKIIYKNLISYSDFINGIIVANILSPEEE